MKRRQRSYRRIVDEKLEATRFIPGPVYSDFAKQPDFICYIARWFDYPGMFRSEREAIAGGHRWQIRLVDLSKPIGHIAYESEVLLHPAFAVAEMSRVTGEHPYAWEIEDAND